MKLVVTRPWMQLILLAAGIYNLIWGFTTLFYPQQFAFTVAQLHTNVAGHCHGRNIIWIWVFTGK